MDMRQGHLGRLNDLTLPDALPINGINAAANSTQTQNSLNPHIGQLMIIEGFIGGILGGFKQIFWRNNVLIYRVI